MSSLDIMKYLLSVEFAMFILRGMIDRDKEAIGDSFPLPTKSYKESPTFEFKSWHQLRCNLVIGCEATISVIRSKEFKINYKRLEKILLKQIKIE